MQKASENQSHQKYTNGRGNKRHNPKQCYRCGDTPHTKGQQYQVIGVECFNCGKRGHFSKVGRPKTSSDVMTLRKKQPDVVTSEYSSYGKVFLGTLEAQDSSSISTIASLDRTAKQPQQSHDRNTSYSRPP